MKTEDITPIDENRKLARTRNVNLEVRLKSARQIALMREPAPQDESFLRKNKIIHANMKDKAVLDAFRELRTKILQISHGENFVAMITSAKPGSGTSFCTLNLAAAFALDDTKTALIVDCHLRNPVQHNLLGIAGASTLPGLTDYIEDPDTMDPEGLAVDDIIYPTGIKRLQLVPAGKRRETSTEYIASAHLEVFLTEVRERYPDRYIFIDAPSITESPEASMLADLSDMVLLCVGYGKSTPTQIAEAAGELNPQKLVGVIFSEGND